MYETNHIEGRYINPLTDYGFKRVFGEKDIMQPIFGKVGGISELVHMSDEERARYNITLDTYRTNLSVMKNERMEGREEGLKEGQKNGREKEKLSIARNAKSLGMSIEQIAALTGLSISEIEEL
ncbi:MAG: hypothetical protein HUJ96_04525 [Marinilabiliaceae bacterium]|nr:hypothetical protein [Marinilabiliaceae bacterium]